jgi:hypothetical protein
MGPFSLDRVCGPGHRRIRVPFPKEDSRTRVAVERGSVICRGGSFCCEPMATLCLGEVLYSRNPPGMNCKWQPILGGRWIRVLAADSFSRVSSDPLEMAAKRVSRDGVKPCQIQVQPSAGRGAGCNLIVIHSFIADAEVGYPGFRRIVPFWLGITPNPMGPECACLAGFRGGS